MDEFDKNNTFGGFNKRAAVTSIVANRDEFARFETQFWSINKINPACFPMIRLVFDEFRPPKNPDSMPNKPIFAAYYCLLWGFTCLFSANSAGATEDLDIRLNSPRGELLEVTTRLNHVGQLSIDDLDDESGPRQLPLKVEARLQFAQRQTGSEQPQAIRVYFPETKATIGISDGKQVSQLAELNQYVVTRAAERGPVRMASLQDVLTQKELELVISPGIHSPYRRC